MSRNIRLLYLHNFLTDLRFQEAFLVIRFAQITGSYTAAMAVLMVVALVSAAMDVPTGMFSDRIGRKYTFMTASFCAVIMVVCYAFAQGPALLYTGALFSGISQALFSGNNTALLYESLKADGHEDRFQHYQGRASSMFQLALCLSAFAASLILRGDLKLIFLLGIVPQVLAFGVSFLFQEPRQHIPIEQNKFQHLCEACRELWRNPRLRWLTLGQAISYGAGESGFDFKFAFVGTLWPVWAVGLYRGLNHMCGFLGFLSASAILKRINGSRYLIVRDLYWFITQSFALMLHNIVTPLIILTSAFAYAPGEVAREQILQREFTDHQRATMASVSSFIASLFYAVMALLLGIIADHVGMTAAVTFGLCISLTSLPVYVYLNRRHF